MLNSVQFAGAFEGLFDDRPAIFVAHNVEHRSAEENAEAARGLLQKFLLPPRGSPARSLERRLCERARFVFTLAEEDRARARRRPPGKSAALPLVTPASAWRFSGPRTTACDAALIGTWTWQPNRIGLDWFLEEVVPLLRRSSASR